MKTLLYNTTLSDTITGFPDDEERVINICRKNGYDIRPSVVRQVWRTYSEFNYCAGWMSMSLYDDETIFSIFMEYCNDSDIMITIDISNLEQRIQCASEAELDASGCAKHTTHGSIDMQLACKDCSIIRIRTALKAAFPEFDL